MSAWPRAALVWLVRSLPTALVLGGLGTLAVWGHFSGWKLPSLAEMRGDKKDKDDKKDEQDEDFVRPGPVTLSSAEDAAKAGIVTAPARRQRLSRAIEAPAVLSFDQRRHAHLSARAPGTAWLVLRDAGDRVKAGDVLALVATPEVGKIKGEFLAAYVQTDLRQKAYDKARAAGSLPERQVREAEQALREARAAQIVSRQALANLGIVVPEAELAGLNDEAVNDRLRTLGLPADVAAKKDAPGNLLPLVAPFDGHVIRRDLVRGEAAGPGQTAFVVADVTRVWALLDVRQEDASRLAVGQEVAFRARAGNGRATGKITMLSAEIDAKTRTVRARAELPNPGGALRPGAFGTARVAVEEVEAVTVPDSAIQWDGQGHRVFIRVDKTTFEPRLVLPGHRAWGRTELIEPGAVVAAGLVGHGALGGPFLAVLSAATGKRVWHGVQPGEAVVTTGSHVLKSEMLKSRIGGEED